MFLKCLKRRNATTQLQRRLLNQPNQHVSVIVIRPNLLRFLSRKIAKVFHFCTHGIMSASRETKECYRQNIWSCMETNDIARFPRPVFNRIPNFKGAEQACSKVKELLEFQSSHVIKVAPDKPLQHIRYLTLEANKVLYVPTPRLKHGLLNKITPPVCPSKHDLQICATSEGVRRFSVRMRLDSKIKIDLVIVGSVAVSIAGYRIGKGEGFSDMEYAMLATLGAVNENTVVITVVHDCQVVESLPEELFKEYDVPADIIVTPTRIIRCEPKLKKPDHIIWSLITEEKMNDIPILRTLKSIEDKNLKNNTEKV